MEICRALSILGTGVALASSAAIQAEVLQPDARYQLQLKYHTEYTRPSSSGSSNGTDTIVVKLVAQRDGGQELEYDLPDAATDKDRLISWQLPARLFVAADGTRTLLNRAALEARRDQFLKAGGWGKDVCGRWLFTWTAVKIECDPNSVFGIIDMFALQPPLLADGAVFAIPGAAGSAPLKCSIDGDGDQRCIVTMPVDADAVRAELADSDVVVGEISGKPVTPADAAKARAGAQISGMIEVTFDAGADGVVTRRTVVTKIERRDSSGETETSRSTAVLTRTRL